MGKGITLQVRRTYHVDTKTDRLIRQLSSDWGLSPDEVIDRSIRIAAAGAAVPTPADVVSHYQTHPAPRSRGETERVIEALRALRHDDDLRRTDAPG